MKLKLWLRKYKRYLENNKIKIPVNVWFGIAIVLGLVFFILIYLFFENLVLGVVGFVAIVDLIIGFPIYKEESRIAEIEKHLPNALREMADILKSGGTYEYALRELTSLDFGPLTREFEKVLIRLEEGSNFESALKELAKIDSDLVKKVVGIIIDSVRAGAGLADVLEEISDDARKLYKLEMDRKAKTTMQVLFIFASGALIAPGIFGLVMTIVEFLINISAQTGVASQAAILTAFTARDTIANALMIYLLFETIASAMMIAMMRDKTVAKAILYFPVLLSVAFIVYYSAMFATKLLLSGMM